MEPIQIVNYIIIGVAAYITYLGLSRAGFMQRYGFEVDPILVQKDYIRLLSSAFLHTGWWHLLFNMYALYIFGDLFNFFQVPVWYYLILFFGSMMGGNALALYVHRNHGNYRAVGASGAVSGIVFSAITFYPQLEIWFVIPGWLFAILFSLISIYGIRSQRDNIGHEAHLGGAITGTLLMLLWEPNILQSHGWVVAAILIPTGIFLYLIITRPEMLMIPMAGIGSFKSAVSASRVKVPKRKAKPRLSPQEEIDALLDKGLDKLSPQEKKRLETLSRQLNQGDV